MRFTTLLYTIFEKEIKSMKKALVLFLLLTACFGFAQKVVQKPVLLKPLAKIQTIGMEYKDDILYFNKADILPFIESKAQVDKHPIYTQMIGYLNSSPNEIALKQKDSTNFKNVGERNLYKTLLQLAPEMRSGGLVSILDKKTKQFNTPKTKAQTVSMEYANEILYFSKTDLISVLTKKSQSDKINIYNPMINYLTGVDKPVLFIYNDTTKLQTQAEKNIHKIILEVAPQLLAEAKAADKVKKTGVFNKQVFVNPCDNNKDKKLITEKKGRIILGCE